MPSMGAITTHVLDTSRGQPAVGVAVVLERRDSRGDWMRIGQGETDKDGRLRDLMPATIALEAGVYRLMFDTRRYFSAQSIATLYPAVVIVIEVLAGESHYHVPLLLSPFGYSTYRGT
jgi:5-hydroxyisourate hydrolase